MENTRKRTRSPSPPPWRRDQHQRPRGGGGGDHSSGDRKSTHNQREQTRLNALQEAEQARAWVSKEDTFVLHQMKKKAEIRVKEGRAKPIDFLAVNLRVIDPQQENPLEDEIPDEDLDIVDPEGILDGLDEEELEELEGEIETYIQLETNKTNGEFWRTMKILCVDRLSKVHPDSTRAVSSVASDVDQLLSKKTLPELQSLEGQIERKLSSNEIIDPDYWNALLRSLRIWKAKASLRQVYGQVIKQRVEILQKQQREEALSVQKKLEQILSGDSESDAAPTSYHSPRPIPYTRLMDPEPLLKLPYNDKSLPTVSEHSFLSTIGAERHKILKLGYVPHKPRAGATNTVVASSSTSKPAASSSSSALAMAPPSNPTSRFAAVFNDDFSSATTALYEREVARGISENEEIFTAEESLHPPTPLWADKYRPRKPRYFNRVQMGYEWNKYNQTHYDHDNPPPKVVQGYKFNIFYPDLIDKSKAPTYRIEREGGRKRGQSFAPAGEEDTCLIRFIAGPPYEDIAFRIVDKEWDYSAKRERGFRSSFEKGILQLHFQLKKIYYRK